MRLPTGIDVLDRDFGGGVPPGTLVAYEAPPDTQAEVLLRVLARRRPTLFLSVIRPAEELREELAADAERARLSNPPDRRVLDAPPDDLLGNPSGFLAGLGEQWNLVVDPVTPLETRDDDRYLNFLNAVKRRLRETGGFGVLFATKLGEEPPGRWLTLQRADATWQLYRGVNSREVSTTLIVAKFRNGRPIAEPRKLLLGDEVRVDTSRDIS